LLTTLFAFGLISAILAQPASNTPTADEKKAIDLVAAAGGKAEIDPKLPTAARVAVTIETATDAVLASLKKAPQVGSLSVTDATKCTDKGFAALKELPHLRKLVIGQSALSSAGVNAIGQCKELRVLYLGNAGLTDAELAGLKKLTLLESLDVSGNPQITDKGMVHIKALERLQFLYLANTSLTDKGLPELKPLDGLRTLNVVGTKVTGDAADRFADDMPNLRAVRR
jgi:Leucine-rich repeat (LRR) protein